MATWGMGLKKQFAPKMVKSLRMNTEDYIRNLESALDYYRAELKLEKTRAAALRDGLRGCCRMGREWKKRAESAERKLSKFQSEVEHDTQ